MKVRDQMERIVQLDKMPRRIISLVPSQTEFLHDLELESEVVGITKFCVHPNAWFKKKQRIGGTKNVNIEDVKNLQPDLIIGNKEENAQEDIAKLEKVAPLWMSDIVSVEDAVEMMREVAKITNREEKGKQLINRTLISFNKLKSTQLHSKSVLYYIWRKPHLLAGKETFIDAMLQLVGLQNLCTEKRYPEDDFTKEMAPNFIFLSSEPYPFKKQHKVELQEKYPNASIHFVDGEMFSWYGSRLLRFEEYWMKLVQELKPTTKQ